jgi:Tfp pilus assembly protein PilF
MSTAHASSYSGNSWWRSLILGSLIAATSGCANMASQQATDTPTKNTNENAAAISSAKVDRPFSSESLYALLVAEMAIDRRRYDIALSNYQQQALTTRDPAVTGRATQIARILEAHSSALALAQQWHELEPSNLDAQLIFMAELIQANRLLEALYQAEQLAGLGQPAPFDSIALRAVGGDPFLLQDLLSRYQALAKRHPQNSLLLLGTSILLTESNRPEEALTAIKRTLTIEPNNLQASYQEAHILQMLGKPELALKKLADLVAANPGNFALRARYARLMSAYDINESREQFKSLLKVAPQDPEILFSLGLVELESGRTDDAEQHFLTLIETGHYLSSANFNLGVIYSQKQDRSSAIKHYQQVQPGHNYVAALSRAKDLLVAEDQSLEALTMLRQARTALAPESPQSGYREGLYILESEVLLSAGQIAAAELLLSEALEEFPDATNALYSRAMLYTRINNLEGAERDLKRIIALNPENAAALNALGYTLADLTDRLDEAYTYISKAFVLAPDDPAVMDSMGWVEYRRGNIPAALVRLRAALKAMPDHEIAAHLGEVLWVSGDSDAARAVWRDALQQNPSSSIIKKTLQRLQVELN